MVNLGGPGNGAAPSSSSSSGRYQPMAYPGQQPPPQQQQQQQYPANYGVSPYPNNPQQMNAQRYPPGPVPPAYGYPAGGGGMAPGMMMMNTNPNSSVLAPGMLNPMAPRKNIPTADSVGKDLSLFQLRRHFHADRSIYLCRWTEWFRFLRRQSRRQCCWRTIRLSGRKR